MGRLGVASATQASNGLKLISGTSARTPDHSSDGSMRRLKGMTLYSRGTPNLCMTQSRKSILELPAIPEADASTLIG